MIDQKIPLTIDGIEESIYAGFWIRLGSLLLDGLILAPYLLLVMYLNGLSMYAQYYTLVPGLLFHFWFNIYLVKKYGGTPGKLIAGIKVLKIDGSEVTWKEAFLRQSVAFALSIFYSLVTLYALSKADLYHYGSLGWMKKSVYLFSFVPVLSLIFTWMNNLWTLGELFVLLFNKRKRALHDFIAKTVIVQSKYVAIIRHQLQLDEEFPAR